MLKRMNPEIFDEMDISKVKLYLTKDKAGEWLSADAPEVTQLMCGEQSAVDLLCRDALDPETQLDKLFESTPRNNQTHVVARIIEVSVEEESGEIVELQCLVVGRANSSPFTSKMKRTQDVRQLKENILASRPRDFSLLSASNLHLYPAQNREGEWLARDQPDVSALCKADSSAVAVWLWDEMHPCTKIGDRFDSAGCQAIRVLVRVSDVLAVVEDDDDEHKEHKKPFCDVAEELREAPEVTRLVEDIKMVFETGLLYADRARLRPLHVVGDSKLIIQQQVRRRPPRADHLRDLYARCRVLADRCGVVSWIHHLRAFNRAADALANLAMDRRRSRQVRTKDMAIDGFVHQLVDSHANGDLRHWLDGQLHNER